MRPIDQLSLVKLGIQHERPVTLEWSIVEAITWIATRDLRMVSGVAPYEANAAATLGRGFGREQIALAERCVASVAAGEIARSFCKCDRKVDSRACVEDWNALSPEEQRSAAINSRAQNNNHYRWAHTYRCECFENAARALFTAAATGRIGAVIGEGKVSRRLWLQADYDLEKGLSLGGHPAGQVSFASAAARRLWPVLKTQARSSGAAGRPVCNDEAVLAAFRNLRAARTPLEPNQLDEWRHCVETARAAGAQTLGQPATYVKKLRSHYTAAKESAKG